MFPPKNIKVPSDGNELTFIETMPKKLNSEVYYNYLYLVSKTQQGQNLILPESQLKKNIANKIFVEI